MEGNLNINQITIFENKNGEMVLSQAVENILDYYVLYKKLLEAMSQYNIKTAKVGKYTISKVDPKEQINFDSDRFCQEVPIEIYLDYVKEENETKLDTESLIEDLKTNYPELIQKHTKTETKKIVNLKSLEQNIPTLYEKYVTRIVSDKLSTLRITSSKK